MEQIIWHGNPLDSSSPVRNFYMSKMPLIGLFFKNIIGNLFTDGERLKLGIETTLDQPNIDELSFDNGGLSYVVNDKIISMLYCHLGSHYEYDFIETKNKFKVVRGTI